MEETHEAWTEREKFRAYGAAQIRKSEYWSYLDPECRHVLDVTTKVLPFRVNKYVLDNLVDWKEVPRDPFFQLLFPQRGMLSDIDFRAVERAVSAGGSELRATVAAIRHRLNPHPAGQTTHNAAWMNGHEIEGVQHKYRETVLFFPPQGQTCHSYCTFCFRWPQFVGDDTLKIQGRNLDQLVCYLQLHPEISDVLVTGGDPMVMSARALENYIRPLLETPVTSIRIGSKSLTYWPFRFTTDDDSDRLLTLFRDVVESGRHLAFMAHINHPRELAPAPARTAIRAIQATGAVIRVQAPVLRHINDDPELWVQLWNESVRLGCVPYYMFVERDTGPSEYFKLPLVRVLEIFQAAYRRVSGLARTVRGPVMSAMPGKVLLDGIVDVGTGRAFQLQYLQARIPELTGEPFFADYDERAHWFDELRPVKQTEACLRADGLPSLLQ
jgi:L-lysine 2,3-aminomutase